MPRIASDWRSGAPCAACPDAGEPTAARLLLETRATVAAIALDVGYESEAAFARAFKRLVGRRPAARRRERDSAPG